MAFRVYVGNYPFNLKKEDVQNLFRDFDGVQVDKICQKNSKSFAFLTCNDIDQLVSVIKNMNGTSVSGRNLIVRASDENLQEYVNLILQNENTSEPEESSPMKIMRNKCRRPYKKSDSENSGIHDKFGGNRKQFEKNSPKNEDNFGSDGKHFEKSSPKNEDNFGATGNHYEKHSPKSEDNFGISQRKSNSSRSMHNVTDCKSSFNSSYSSPKIGEKLNDQPNLRSNDKSHENNAYFSGNSPASYQSGSDKNEHEHFETSSNHSYKSQKNYHQATYQNETNSTGNTTPDFQRYCQQKSKRNDHGQFNNFSRYSSNNTSDTDSQASKYENNEHFYEQRETSSPTWVSVTNFKIGTNARAFYDLFSDYNPLRVKMICNQPRRDKMLAEAHVCFPSKEIADDVILNFDNTMFEGRIILVNDVEDLTIMNELLNISHS